MADTDDTATRCLARIQLRPEEVAWLTDRPHAAHEVSAEPYCDLEMGHDGVHAAIGQQGDQTEWWIWWTLTASEIVETAICPAYTAEPVNEFGEHGPCLLFKDHPGRHSFDLASRR